MTVLEKIGIDDKISHIDSALTYEENKELITRNFGRVDSDKEMMDKYNRYSDMSKDSIYN